MPGEWFEWEWDETLFAGTAAYYDHEVSRTLAGSVSPKFSVVLAKTSG